MSECWINNTKKSEILLENHNLIDGFSGTKITAGRKWSLALLVAVNLACSWGKARAARWQGCRYDIQTHTCTHKCTQVCIGGELARNRGRRDRFSGIASAVTRTTARNAAHNPGLSCPMCLLDDFIPITAYPRAIAYTPPAPAAATPLPFSRAISPPLPERKRRLSTITISTCK